MLLDDMDKKQAAGDPTPETIRRARLGFADKMDQYIAAMYGQAGTSISHTQVVSSNVISTLSSGLTKLRENSVPTSETVYLVASPRIAEKIMLADIVYNTDNSDTLSNGLIGRIKFLNMEVYTSVNIVTSDNVDYCMMFTKQAISLAEQVPVGSIEKLRSPDTLADIVRGFHLFGAKVLKPKELVTLALKPGNESTVYGGDLMADILEMTVNATPRRLRERRSSRVYRSACNGWTQRLPCWHTRSPTLSFA